jgi:alkylated DNA repair dioxygenase AlkB
MIDQLNLGDKPFTRFRTLQALIVKGEITMSGYKRGKIYGTLTCKAGKRMKPENRVFFKNETEALAAGYRPCANCLPDKYKKWKNMELFEINSDKNILPYDGIVNYYGKILDNPKADHYRDKLLDTIQWKNDEAVIFGRHIITKRKVAWYGDEGYRYTYSNTTKHALGWTKELLKLKTLVEQLTGERYNSCLLNLYHNGDEGMAWHSDDEKALGKDTSIASLSFGAERKFALKHRVSKHPVSLILEHGSLLVMKGTTQTHWLHSLPKSKKITGPRVNLTFRTMV